MDVDTSGPPPADINFQDSAPPANISDVLEILGDMFNQTYNVTKSANQSDNAVPMYQDESEDQVKDLFPSAPEISGPPHGKGW